MKDRTAGFLLTPLALIAFASNSLLCRKALGGEAIDAATFTTIRLVSGAVMLWMLSRLRSGSRESERMDRVAAAWLFLYAAAFSFAYLWLSAGTGALILFAAVQFTMISSGYRGGEEFSAASWTGLILSFGGLLFLVSPGLSAPPLKGALLMAVAGTAWGFYSLRSRGAKDPLGRTAGNFLAATVPTLALSLLFLGTAHVSAIGLWLAILSGAVTSGVGYVIWYAALRHLSSTAAASVQLAVPVLAGLGGVIALGEQFTFRLMGASVIILSGITLVLKSRAARKSPVRVAAEGSV